MLGKVTAKLSYCGQVGAFSGFFAASFFAWFNSRVPMNSVLNLLIIWAVSWLVILLFAWAFYGVMVRYGWPQIARVTIIVTFFSTIAVFALLHFFYGPFALIIGFLAGMFVGILFTRICQQKKPSRRKSDV